MFIDHNNELSAPCDCKPNDNDVPLPDGQVVAIRAICHHGISAPQTPEQIWGTNGVQVVHAVGSIVEMWAADVVSQHTNIYAITWQAADDQINDSINTHEFLIELDPGGAANLMWAQCPVGATMESDTDGNPVTMGGYHAHEEAGEWALDALLRAMMGVN